MAYTKIIWRNNKYVLQVKTTKDGKYKQLFASKKKQEVNRKRSEVKAQSINVEAELQRKTFVDVYEEFYKSKIEDASHQYSKLRLSSVQCYRTYYTKYIKPYFDNRVLLTEITPVKHARPFFLKLREIGCSWMHAKIVVTSFLTCLKYAVEKEYIYPDKIGAFAVWKPKRDPVCADPDPSKMVFKQTEMISLTEVMRLLQHLKPISGLKKISRSANGIIHESTDIKDWQKYAVISTFIFAGMRISEVRGLKWDCVDLNNREIEIKRTVVGNGASKDQVKAIGSKRTILMHKYLHSILSEWKRLLRKYYGDKIPEHLEHKQTSLTYVFPSLRSVGIIIPVSDKTISDWVKLAFAAVGLAEIKIHTNKNRPDQKAFIQITKSRFKGAITKTFRHFYCTALLNAQAKHPEALTNNFIKRNAGHRDDKTTRMIYGDHQNFDNNIELQQKAVDDSIPIAIAPPDDWDKNTGNLDKDDLLLNP